MKRAPLTAAYETELQLTELLLEMLEKSGLKRREVAARLGVKTATLTAWLYGSGLTVFRAARIAQALGAGLVFDVEPACRKCGCTQNRACDGGCSWVEADLCSACA